MSVPRPIRCLAIANRGEAAMRCLRTVKALRAREGTPLESVALYTEVDRDAPFVRHADRALALAPAASPVAAYLDREGMLETLRRAGADAVWPGWGFLAEDPVFVERCTAAGIRFLGPPAAAMRALGDKIDAKRLAESQRVPVLPWSGGEVYEEAEALRHAEAIGYPLLVKASAGGGGRGIRLAAAAEALPEALRAARAEALAAFGDDRVFLEAAVRGGRHIEVQIVADEHGTVHALGCRDCSVQRRHQKVIEEAPPPDLSRAFLAALEEDARRLAAAVGYRGVGTVEFLVAGDAYHFLEMNPRLQVEHGVSEAVTGLDLVELQIRVARGESLADLAWREDGAAIEARVCAEDPDAGFLPTPGRVACFDAALGPHVRVDSGVALGSVVPGAFDSLIAKVIATGATRAEARARLACALSDFELLIEGGATNKGFLIDLLETPELRAGAVDTGWLDRGGCARRAASLYAVEALVAAAIIAYQRARRAARLHFYADTTTLHAARIPPSEGQRIDLTYRGEAYPLQVYAIGSWRYRVHLEGEVVAATLREESARSGRLQIGARSLRLLYDPTEAGLRVEIESRPHRFGWQVAGEVRASTPAMVVSIDVGPGDRVEAGQPLGFLEAMKMEIGFAAPVSGVVQEVRARKGQQVAAGDVLLVIEPADGEAADARRGERLALPKQTDPLAPLFEPGPDGALGEPAPTAGDAADPDARSQAMEAIRGEVRRVFLGYDANPARAEKLASFLEVELPAGLSEGFRWRLAEIRHELQVVADLYQLFVRSPRGSVGGELGVSNSARLRMFVRRIRAGGAGIAGEFLDLMRRALRHYDVTDLEHSDALERALLRLLATQRSGALHQRLLLAVLRCVTRLAWSGIHLGDDRALQDALARLVAMRGLVSDAVADAALEASYVIFERPAIEREAERTSKRLEAWLAAAASEPTAAPEEVLCHLVEAPRPVFDRVGRWIADPDPRRRAIALAAHLRRLYAPASLASHTPERNGGPPRDRLELADGRTVLGAACAIDELPAATQRLCAAAAHAGLGAGPRELDALELFAPLPDGADPAVLAETVRGALGAPLPARRFTLDLVTDGGPDRHFTFVASPEGPRLDASLHGVHPEAAVRIDLARLVKFELERCDAPDGIYCFHGRAREEAGDARIFVLADVRGGAREEGQEAELYVPIFEQAFYEATRALRNVLGVRDPKRRLQWNRVTICVSPVVALDRAFAERISERLAPAVRNLGIEKVVARMRVLDREQAGASAAPVEIVITDLTGSNMEIEWRTPRSSPLEPRTDYERRVADARRRRLVYPYEIVRMLTGSGRPHGLGTRGAALPVGRFEEFDLVPDAPAPRAHSVAGRPFGRNTSAIVFGLIRTATEKVPEGIERVLILSDPTLGMGSLAGPECDRVVAAIDLAETRGVPVEWIPISSGARIAMDSGTENLDATARAVRRIVTFTQGGGTIHVIVHGVNVGAQSYWDALATMLMHTRGALIMTPGASLVLTGRAALEASGGVAAEDEVGIGGFERVMGPSGQAQYYAVDLADAYRILYDHYRYTYVVPGERGPRAAPTSDPIERSLVDFPCREDGSDFTRVGEIFDDATNPGRKKPFPMRAVMAALVDQDGGHLERWRQWVGAETAIVWDAHVGGVAATIIGIEGRSVTREGYRPADGPEAWTGGTLFPQSSKKVARALNAASGNRPVVVLANLSGFDGSPESMRKLQLEYGAEIARAVVNFAGPILFVVVSRYHGGAYVVFSQALNPQLEAVALRGSYASVIGGGPAAAVVFNREVRARASAHPRIRSLQQELRRDPDAEVRGRLEAALEEVTLAVQAEVAAEFDAVHTVERARDVGSLRELVEPAELRPFVVRALRRA
ncbi:biotin/lipoyl-binding protein [Myxococcota bacterium]|nr:biotin/lipoyl-binding protein [Myxococcota bacterium]